MDNKDESSSASAKCRDFYIESKSNNRFVYMYITNYMHIHVLTSYYLHIYIYKTPERDRDSARELSER